MKDLDSRELIEKLDQERMREALAGFPRQCEQAFASGRKMLIAKDLGRINNIVFCGMGGSAIGAEIVCSYLRRELKLAATVNKDYTLPRFVNGNSLVIVSSYSGNTEETLSAYKQAQENKAKIIVLTTNGQLKQWAEKDDHPILTLPSGFAPRAALAFLSLPVLAILARLELIANQDKQVQELISLLAKLEKTTLDIKVKIKSNPAKRLALVLLDNFCCIYAAGEHLSGVATRWRGQLAENSKALSSSHLFPEMNHNEIVGWQHPQELLKRFIALFLRDKDDHPRVAKRIEITKEILQNQGIRVEEIHSQGEGLLARTFSLIYTGDYLSFYLALLNNEDPTPVKRIDYLKQRLKES